MTPDQGTRCPHPTDVPKREVYAAAGPGVCVGGSTPRESMFAQARRVVGDIRARTGPRVTCPAFLTSGPQMCEQHRPRGCPLTSVSGTAGAPTGPGGQREGTVLSSMGLATGTGARALEGRGSPGRCQRQCRGVGRTGCLSLPAHLVPWSREGIPSPEPGSRSLLSLQ